MIELIPVIEIGYNNQGVTVPEKYPYWGHPELWNRYHDECYSKAGFKDPMAPRLGGSSFYCFSALTDSNLAKIISDHTEDMRAGLYGRTEFCALFGGYVLRLNDEDVYFPQCCGDLSDLEYWEDLTKEGKNVFYQGHPAPSVKVLNDKIVFDFVEPAIDESFAPPPLYTKIELDKAALAIAVEKAKRELDAFIERVEGITAIRELHVDDIGRLVVWGGSRK